MGDIHICGYYCDRPACVKAQRDELREDLRTALDDLTIEATECIALRQRVAELERKITALRGNGDAERLLRSANAAINEAMKG